MEKSSSDGDLPVLLIKTNLDIPLTGRVTNQIYKLIVSGSVNRTNIEAKKGSLLTTFLVFFFLPMEGAVFGKILEKLFTYFSRILRDETEKGRPPPPNIEIEYTGPDGIKLTIKLTGEVNEIDKIFSFLKETKLK